MSIAAVHARIVEIQERFTSSVPAPAAANFAVSLASAIDRTAAAQPETRPIGAVAAAHATSLTRAPAPASMIPNQGLRPSSVDVPPILAEFGNGRIPPNALTQIGVGNHRMWAPAAAAFQHLASDAEAAGVRIGVTDSYRSYDQQVDLAQRKGLYSQGGLAASPGRSNHGWGLSLDLDLDARGQQWMRANAARYGFVEDVPREPWHWTYRAPSG